MRGRNITYKYKEFEYDEKTKNLLYSTVLTDIDKKNLKEIHAYYEALGINRGYKYIIEDLYMLTVKKEVSTTDMAIIYGVTPRTIQIWLKELGINRNKKQAQKIAAAKRKNINKELK